MYFHFRFHFKEGSKIMGNNNDQDSGNGPGKGQSKGAGPRNWKSEEKRVRTRKVRNKGEFITGFNIQ